MKILGREINILKRKPETSAEIPQYPQDMQTQTFARYHNVMGEQQLSYEIIDKLYEKTIINRVINKIAGDATAMNYKIRIVDLEGNEDKDIEDIGKFLDVKITRKVLRSAIRDMLKYGTAFLYISYGADNFPETMYTIHPRLLTPIIEDGVLVAWEYDDEGTPIELDPESIIHIPNDPQTGEIYGQSILGPLMDVLELLLNSQLNTAILVDRYAIPIIQWLIDNQIEGSRTTYKEIEEFMRSLFDQLDVGSDIGTDSGVRANVIGADQNLIDFVPVVRELKETFGVMCGVPLQLLGMRGDNLSVTTRQMQSYIDLVRDYQETVADRLIESLYKPYLESQGFIQFEHYLDIYLSFPVKSVEENSKSATWIFPAVNLGIIDRDEARNTLGYKGNAIPIDEIEAPNIQPEVIRPGARKDPTEEPGEDEPDESDEEIEE